VTNQQQIEVMKHRVCHIASICCALLYSVLYNKYTTNRS